MPFKFRQRHPFIALLNTPRMHPYSNHGYELQSKLWKQIPQQVAGYYTLHFAGLFNLPIPLRFAFGIGVSTITFLLILVMQERERTVLITAEMALFW
jgi:hypothetical protein